MHSSYNPFVDYLNRYTTASPDHEAAFDEFVASTPPPAAGPLRLETRLERFLEQQFQTDQPPSVILTGNAGDGKTYLCRRIATLLQPNHFTDIDWDALIDQPIPRNGMHFFIIKDLSELNEEKGKEILKRLAQTLRDPARRERYLIAANEGRLRALLSSLSDSDEKDLEENIRIQLDGKETFSTSPLIVINLNQVATSTFVPQTLRWMTDPRHWRDCEHCTAHGHCPISYNAQQLRNEKIAQRIQIFYQLLEETGEHITFRDMLIHLAYTISGGKRCADISDDFQQRRDLSQLAYYENVFGYSDNKILKRKAHVIRLLDQLKIGRHSVFDIDEFIISGGNTPEQQQEHRQLFGETVDLYFKHFGQIRRKYLSGNEQEQEVIKWLPHCRRKLFFESSDVKYQLLPFRFYQDYQTLLSQPNKRHEEVLRLFLKGLNRAFSRLYLNETEYLFVTTQYLHSVNQPYPLVLLKLPIVNLQFQIKTASSHHVDSVTGRLYLEIYPPAKVHKNTNPVQWPVGLLQFEYVIRLAMGGHYSILATQCELDVRRLKDQLISAFVIEQDQDSELSPPVEFFVPARNRFEPRRIGIDEHGKITTM
ncbi:hypothetical protein [Chloroflexus sp.]|uniref:hypothetical protein n=1 Tax=Chloroflexus sp. TaxID=1904827 RepID=UPI00257F077D|nr:hypothetical protein [Chloroflexus sp.]